VTAPGRRRSAGVVDATLVFAALTIIISSFGIVTGRYGGPDEPAHVIRAAAVAQGDFTGSAAEGMDEGFRVVTVPIGVGSGDPSCYRHDPRASPNCAEAAVTPSTVTVATAAGTYPPYYYLVVGGVTRLVGGANDPAVYRVVASLLVAAVLTMVLLRIRGWRNRTAAVLAVAMLPPAAWFLFGVVNPNGLEIALFALAWAGVVEHLSKQTPNGPSSHVSTGLQVAAWAIALAIAIRPVAVFTLPTVAVVLTAFTPAHRRVSLLDRRVLLRLAAPIAAAFILTAVWHLVLPAATSDSRTASSLSLRSAIGRAASDTDDTIREIVGSLGWLEYAAPGLAQLGWWCVVGGAFIACIGAGGRWTAQFVATCLAVLATPVAFETITAGRVGFIWQGRYSISAALGVVAVGVVAAGLVADNHDQLLAKRARWVAPFAATLAICSVVITLWQVARRYTVGADGPWRLTPANWSAPVHPWIAVAAAVAALGLLVAWWQLTSDDVAEDVNDEVG
jgi:hypothetical protein